MTTEPPIGFVVIQSSGKRTSVRRKNREESITPFPILVNHDRRLAAGVHEKCREASGEWPFDKFEPIVQDADQAVAARIIMLIFARIELARGAILKWHRAIA